MENDMSDYRDPSLPVDERVDWLLETMTLKEKVGPLRQLKEWNDYGVDIAAFKKAIGSGTRPKSVLRRL